MLVHGVDLVSVAKFDKMICSQGYLDRCYTPEEQKHCKGSAERYAARFAAKEAVLKALGVGIANGISLKDIEVVFRVGGSPAVSLTGGAAAAAHELRIQTWVLSFAHSDGYAIASVIGIASPQSQTFTPA